MMYLRKVVVILGIAGLLLISSSLTTFSADVTDLTGDVSPDQGYPFEIDLITVRIQGSSIIIELPVEFSLPLKGEYHYLVLLASGGWEGWDGAIALTATPGGTVINWKVGSLDDTQLWNTDYATNHHLISGNLIQLVFLEYSDLVTANIAVLAIATTGSDTFYDWAPNIYQNHIGFSRFSSLVDVSLQFSGGEVTDTSTTSVSDTTTPLSDTTTDTGTTASTDVTTSETGQTQTDDQPPGDELTETGTQPSINLDYYVLLGIVPLPLLVFLRKRRYT